MPDRPQDPAPPPKVISQKNETSGSNSETHMSHTVPMGFNISDCDDGKTNLTVDWDNSEVNYTCYGQKIVPSYQIEPLIYCEKIPKAYKAAHICMHKKIKYVDDIPLYGSHRPVWPVYGEYKFVPPQRWVHSLEHGAVVMLYHPCANPYEVKILKTLVKNCLRRYIVTPYNLLDEDRPLALLTWGCRLTMSYVNPAVVRKFIKKKALHGPERISANGGFSEGLLRKSAIVTDRNDTILCPNA
ncbi:uncharacterized protein LOC107272421 isoform X2 [Cephus cinctus]|nr:uncharacterized protein LOC107272421 isoform X2 [Cephus cinctus]